MPFVWKNTGSTRDEVMSFLLQHGYITIEGAVTEAALHAGLAWSKEGYAANVVGWVSYQWNTARYVELREKDRTSIPPQ